MIEGIILFLHGLLVQGRWYVWYTPLDEYFIEMQVDAHILSRPSGLTEAQRLEHYIKLIQEKFPGKKLHLVGHSAGGTDALNLLSSIIRPQIASVTLIGTPVLGTPIADMVLEGKLAPKVIEFLFDKYENGETIVREMSTAYRKEWARQLNLPDVPIFNMGFFIESMFKVHWATVPNYLRLKRLGHPLNDGVIPLENQFIPENKRPPVYIGKEVPGEHKAETFSWFKYDDKELWRQVFKEALFFIRKVEGRSKR